MEPVTVVTDSEHFQTVAAEAPAGARVPVEVRVVVTDPYDAYRRARKGLGGVFLETSGGVEGWGYFGVEPTEHVQIAPDAERWPAASEPISEDQNHEADLLDGAPTAVDAPTLAALDGLLSGETLVRGNCEVPFPCGLIGWLSYDVARELEELPETSRDDRELPHAEFGLFDVVAAWREPRVGETTLHVTACPRVEASADLDAVYEEALMDARTVARAAVEGDPTPPEAPITTESARFESDCGRDTFAERVRQVKEYIREGDTFQANISQRLRAPAAVHPLMAYDALRRINPAPYSGLLEFQSCDLVSASPELLLHLEDDEIETEPIAGTRPRGETATEDAALERELRNDVKERAEHAMLVDLERNDLGKVSRFGSVSVPEYHRVDHYSEVMHLVSLVRGRLRPGIGVADAVAAAFPGGTITGAPKPQTMGIIDELEAVRRGPYTGSIGILGFDGRATLNIVIRTLVRYQDEYHLRVGAGVVHDSVPEREYDETLAKARALVRAIDEAIGEQTDLGVAEAGTEG